MLDGVKGTRPLEGTNIRLGQGNDGIKAYANPFRERFIIFRSTSTCTELHSHNGIQK